MATEAIEIRELIRQSRVGSRFRLILIGVGLLCLVFMTIVIKFKTDLFLRLVLFLSGYLILVGLLNVIVRRQKEKKRIHELNFLHTIIDFVCIIFIIHYLGGLGWIMPFIYIGVMAFVYVILPPAEAFFLTFLLLVLVGGLGIFEYFGFFSHYSVFSSFDLYNNYKYFITTILSFFGLIISMGATLTFFAGSIRKKSELLKRRAEDTEEIKNSLEIRVGARKKELEGLVKELDTEARQKSKDLEKKIGELKAFNSQTIKKELRMVELKKEIKKLKGELRK